MSPEQKGAAWIGPYEGQDMVGYMLAQGFELGDRSAGLILSMTNVRDTAIIVTEFCVYRARPDSGFGFCIERLAVL